MTATAELVFNPALEPEVLTDKDKTKDVPCRKCGRRCVVTLFATPEKTECLTCRGINRQEQKAAVVRKAAETVDPAKLENLSDALINDHFKQLPLCPFDPEHEVELKSVAHSDAYGPRHLEGYDGRGHPQYQQQMGESAMYQCNNCKCVISYSTMHPVELRAQNEARRVGPRESTLASVLGTR